MIWSTCYGGAQCLYWKKLIGTLNRVFQVQFSENPKQCLLGILDDIPVEDTSRQAIARALFQARKLILRHWKSTDPPTVQEWITQMGDTIRLENFICQHSGCKGKKYGPLVRCSRFSANWPCFGPYTVTAVRLLYYVLSGSIVIALEWYLYFY